MTRIARISKSVVTAFALTAGAASAQGEDPLADLFTALRTAQGSDAEQIVGKIATEWSKSGSPSMDLLLERGRDAMDAGRTEEAIDHFSALIDHDPEFAEGYNARATAFFREREFGLAMADLESTLTLNPRHFGALTGVAVILTDIGSPELALQAWREVVKLYPASPEAQSAIERLEREVEGRSL